MKKTFPANISGKIYYIDEDAYNLLQKYFTQLRASFPGEEGQEIVCDIEGRVAEIFEDKIAAGASVVNLSDVNEVIDRMGRPEQISEDGDAAGGGANKDWSFISVNLPKNRRLYRDTRNKVFGGVISGLASYLKWDSNIMRLLVVVLALCSYVIPFVVVYLVMWMVVPPASTSRQILEMQGRPVTVDGVGQTVLDTATPPPYGGDSCARGAADSFGSFLSGSFRLLGKCVMVLLLVLGSIVGVTAVVFIILGGTTLLLGLCYGNFELASNIGVSLSLPRFSYELWTMILAGLVAVVPCVVIVWAACASLLGSRSVPVAFIVSSIIIEVLLIAVLFVMANMINGCFMMCALSVAAPSMAFLA